MTNKAGNAAHYNAYIVKILETYHGDEVSAELFESHFWEGVTPLKHPFGVRIFDLDANETIPFGVHRFETLDAARAYFEGIE